MKIPTKKKKEKENHISKTHLKHTKEKKVVLKRGKKLLSVKHIWDNGNGY